MKHSLTLWACTAALLARTAASAQTASEAATAATDIAKLQTALNADEKKLNDWPNLARYREQNAMLPVASDDRVIFMGDSITDNWGRKYAKFFPDKPFINRGIGGQTAPQMLLRFRLDVIALKPKAVVILAGTNDIAGNTGLETLNEIEGYLTSMAELAKANGIRVVLASVLPVCDAYRNQTVRRPPEKIVQLNTWIKKYCEEHGLIYLDYYSATIDSNKMLRKEITEDGLHPNEAGYAIMEPLALQAIAQALKQ